MCNMRLADPFDQSGWNQVCKVWPPRLAAIQRHAIGRCLCLIHAVLVALVTLQDLL
jgi:hypothetical protein